MQAAEVLVAVDRQDHPIEGANHLEAVEGGQVDALAGIVGDLIATDGVDDRARV